ncbi:S1/P1 nuclease [Bradyrhizobium sp. ARR65]|uniref:S1/P1 nuclease n=1 Tax=Bradyrhizobium sp. ARR65 TaxID=1040989 RepID=UPI0018DE264F|nr:S1/P1 nuclease [Bradyrhizobium sp. ARR65]
MRIALAAIGPSLAIADPRLALAWSDDGHKTIALVAEQCLMPSAKRRIMAMLASDTGNTLTKHDFASEATWADKYRDEDDRRLHYEQTQNWHFVDIELDSPDIATACFGREPLQVGTPASNGPAKACVVDKIQQFETEISANGTDPGESLMALKFILHFVGDMHQPLHSSDNHDRGGNDVKIEVDGFPHSSKDVLHGFWDTQFVDALGSPPDSIASSLLAEITPSLAKEWTQGTLDDWAMEAFNLSRSDAYGSPPLSKSALQHLRSEYVGPASASPFF